MNAPDQIADSDQFQRISREYSRLKPIVKTFEEYRDVRDEWNESRQLLEESEGDMRELAREEVHRLESRLEELGDELKQLLIPEDPDRERHVILEIRAGTGGEEAALFAADLFRMYSRYADRQGWTTKTVDPSPSDRGGYKEVVASIEGKGAFGDLQFESGIHRVQRVPETESGGRIHTSAATVAVLPEAGEIDVEVNNEDLRIDTFRASGAGGQHVNKTESAIRITHEPTGVVVECQDERSQHKNRAQAMKILRSRLYERAKQEQKQKRREKRRDQVGSGDRSGKIRTYNFPQNRVTDHRVNLDIHNLEAVLDGELDELIQALREDDRIEKLNRIEEEGEILSLVG